MQKNGFKIKLGQKGFGNNQATYVLAIQAQASSSSSICFSDVENSHR